MYQLRFRGLRRRYNQCIRTAWPATLAAAAGGRILLADVLLHSDPPAPGPVEPTSVSGRTAMRSLGQALSVLALLFAAACGASDRTYTIEDVREGAASAPQAPATSAERFGMGGPVGAGHGQPGGDPHGGPHGGAPQAAPKFKWEVPLGWKEVAATRMRAANFKIERDAALECYLTALPGMAGGVVANINRWRKQIGLEAMAQHDIVGLPKRQFLGRAALFVDLQGTFSGMGGAKRDGYRMLGLILERPGQTVFLKMTGPARSVEAERAHFLELAASFKEETGGAPPKPAGTGSGGWQWKAPDHWERMPPRTMRLVSFVPKGASNTECYITILGGAAGGLGPNVNRWRVQMGQQPLDAAGLAKLPTIKVLGQDAPFLDVSGSFTGMGGEKVAEATMYATICPLEGRVVFVKMTGPTAVLQKEKDNFVAFCESLKAP